MNSWILKQNYPQFKRENGSYSVTLAFSVKWENLFAEMPEDGSKLPLHLFPDIPADNLEHLQLQNVSFGNSPGGNFAKVILQYAEPGTSGLNSGSPQRFEGQTEYTATNATLEKPIETHDKYVVSWNYHLVKRTGTNEPKPADWQTKKVAALSSKDWKFVKEMSEIPDGWELTDEKTKPGQESYVLPSLIVNENTYYKKQQKANNALSVVGTPQTPANTFGKSGGKWLVMGGRIFYDKGYWVVERNYQYADKLDQDFYG